MNRVLPWDGWGGRIMATVMARGNTDMEFAAVEMLNLKSDSNVAMIGCGPGIGVVECARRISSGIVIGLDPSIVMTERTRKRCRRARVEQVTKVERASAESLPLSDRSQDAVVSVNNIQLWTNRSVGLDECTRVLVPGGVIVVLLHMWAIPSILSREEWIKQLRDDLSTRDVHVEKPRIRRFRSGKALVLIGKRSK